MRLRADKLPEPLLGESLAAAGGCRHGFFTRRGGVSSGPWDSLNVGLHSGDEAENISSNRARIAETLGFKAGALITARQIHCAHAISVTAPFDSRAVPAADGLVTTRSGILLGVLGADCPPVLLIDPDVPVIAALHAGWRGALGGIVAATVDLMERMGARRRRLRAAIGPAIAMPSYEVGEEFRARFLENYPGATRFFRSPEPTDADGRPHFDLPGFVGDRLEASGVGTIEDLARDTYAEDELFFSCRRAAKTSDGRYGLQMSGIGLQ